MSKKAARQSRSAEQGRLLRWVFPALIALTGLLLLLFLRTYTENFSRTVWEETRTYMTEIAEQVTLVMNDRVERGLKNLETDAVAATQLGLDTESAVGFLADESRRYGYSGMSLAGTDGRAIDESGRHITVSSRPHFLRALMGEATVSELMTASYGAGDYIEFAVPMRRAGEVVGVLMANYKLADFRDILTVNLFNGQGSAVVVDARGIVIVSGERDHAFNVFTSLEEEGALDQQSLERLTRDIAKGVGGSIDYSSGQASPLLYYQPLGINDWMLLITAPTDQISSRTNLLMQGLVYVGLFIALLVALLMLFVIINQRSNRRRLERLLYVDPVTGGDSYAKFLREAKLLVAASDQPYVLMQFNLEKFRLINTTFGREEGDRFLRFVYHAIADCLAPDELVARVNADRFCLLLRSGSREEITERVNGFGERIKRFNDTRPDNYLLRFNVGVRAVDSPEQDIAMLYEQANFSRTHGSTRQCALGAIAFYDETERDLILREKELENRMERALAQGEFHAYIQPKYELAANTICGGEALVRWIVPGQGMMSPAEFIPLFERNGFIVDVDLCMFEQVCQLQQRRWDAGLRCLPVSINLSRRHLDQLDFLARYREIFSRYTFPPSLLEIELTESIVFDNTKRLIEVIDQLHEIGFSCSMDDFGSGYSSLNMLKEIPVDVLKLDRAFFYSASGDLEKSHHVIETIINLAGKLNMKTLSEGIETPEQIDYLRSVNCDMVQGYVFARPQPIEQFEQLIEEDAHHENRP